VRKVFKAPHTPALKAIDRSPKTLSVSGRLKSAIDRMVWNGMRRPQAAQASGMTDHGVREALRKPHVKAYLLEQMQVLRDSERPRNIHRLAEIRDAANNMPAVQAIRALEEMHDPIAGGKHSPTPGLVIHIAATEAKPVTIDVSPADVSNNPAENDD
jgi:hypothetical protein